jgi:hypothetical protein
VILETQDPAAQLAYGFGSEKGTVFDLEDRTKATEQLGGFIRIHRF